MNTEKKSRSQWGKRLWMGAVSLTMSIMVVTGGGVSAADSAESGQEAAMIPPVTAAYVYDQAGLNLRSADAPYLSQLNYAFALIDNGRVTGDHWHGIKAFEKYVKNHPHILPVMAVGGWGADGFSQAAATAEGRETFVQSALALMEKHGFLGIDLDWEYPGSTVAGIKASEKDGENFVLLLQTLRQGLDDLTAQDGKTRYLSVALGALPAHSKAIDLKALGSLADQVNLMTYDLTGFDKTTGHHAALYGDDSLSGHSSVQYYIDQGIPAQKLMLGAAFYGRCWRQVQGSGNGLGQKAATSGNKTYTYTQLQKMIADGEFEPQWDDAAKAPYLFDGDRFISYENEESCRLKGQYASENQLMGVVAWQYGQDDSGSLLQALYEGLNTP